MRGVTSDFDDEIAARKFQPALPMRGVTGVPVVQHGGKVFQPALPMRGVTGTVSSSAISSCVFQPALPMRGVTSYSIIPPFTVLISTRTPHAGSDHEQVFQRDLLVDISTRTPHAGSDTMMQRDSPL